MIMCLPAYYYLTISAISFSAHNNIKYSSPFACSILGCIDERARAIRPTNPDHWQKRLHLRGSIGYGSLLLVGSLGGPILGSMKDFEERSSEGSSIIGFDTAENEPSKIWQIWHISAFGRMSAAEMEYDPGT